MNSAHCHHIYIIRYLHFLSYVDSTILHMGCILDVTKTLFLKRLSVARSI